MLGPAKGRLIMNDTIAPLRGCTFIGDTGQFNAKFLILLLRRSQQRHSTLHIDNRRATRPPLSVSQVAALPVVPFLGPLLALSARTCIYAQMYKNVSPTQIYILNILKYQRAGWLATFGLWIISQRCRCKAEKCWPLDSLRSPLFLPNWSCDSCWHSCIQVSTGGNLYIQQSYLNCKQLREGFFPWDAFYKKSSWQIQQQTGFKQGITPC
jgi:hypothetical protein